MEIRPHFKLPSIHHLFPFHHVEYVPKSVNGLACGLVLVVLAEESLYFWGNTPASLHHRSIQALPVLPSREVHLNLFFIRSCQTEKWQRLGRAISKEESGEAYVEYVLKWFCYIAPKMVRGSYTETLWCGEMYTIWKFYFNRYEWSSVSQTATEILLLIPPSIGVTSAYVVTARVLRVCWDLISAPQTWMACAFIHWVTCQFSRDLSEVRQDISKDRSGRGRGYNSKLQMG